MYITPRVRIARVNSTGRPHLAASIAAARATCILPNRHNSDQVRMQRNVTRTAKRRSYRKEHDVIYDTIAEDKRKLAAITEEKKAIVARLKDLNTKKEMGRIPRHSTSWSVASTSAIPQFVGHAEDSGSGKLCGVLVAPAANEDIRKFGLKHGARLPCPGQFICVDVSCSELPWYVADLFYFIFQILRADPIHHSKSTNLISLVVQ
jgi:hypothetical protein